MAGSVVAVNAPARAVAGDASTVDYALSFNGSSDYLEASEGSQYTSRAIYTVQTWVNPAVVACGSSNGCAIASHDGDWWIGIKDGKFQYLVYQAGQGSNTGYVDSGVSATANTWSHLTLVRNNTALTFYVNGIAVKTSTLTSGRSTYSGYPIKVGAHYGNHFTGQIDELKIWSAVRDATAIATDMHTYQTSASTTTNLIAYFDFNEGGTNSTVNNRVGAGADLVFMNASPLINYVDVKSTSRVAGKTVLSFPRSYLTPVGGWTVPTGITRVDALAIGGGGGGAENVGAGGSGGGFAQAVKTVTPESAFTVVVGQGGRAGTYTADTNTVTTLRDGGDGQSSRLGFSTAVVGTGGTGGQTYWGSNQCAGSTANNVDSIGAAGTGGDSNLAGGKGGKGAPGSGTGTSGGSGNSSSISGSSVAYGSGGRGGDWTNSNAGTAGAANTGNGGGGGGITCGAGAAGGSGIVILAYATTDDTAFDFPSGIDAQLRAANKQVIPSQASFTFETWFYADSLRSGNAWNDIFRQQATSSNYKAFGLGVYDGQIQFIHSVQDSDPGTLNTASPSNPLLKVVAGNWYHVALTSAYSVSGSNRTYDWNVYVNGKLALTKSHTTSSPSTLGNTAVSIGNLHDGSGTRAWDGRVDQIKVWNGALTESEIVRSMHTYGASSVVDTSSSTLRAHIDFNTSNANALVDQTGNGYDFTLKSGATAPGIYQIMQTSTPTGKRVYQFERSYLNAWGGWVPTFGTSSATGLVVGGGGGGGSRHAGGGGAGELGAYTGLSITTGSVIRVKVGAGGAGFDSPTNNTNSTGTSGQSSIFGSDEFLGGGGGQGAIGSVSNGGSGGGTAGNGAAGGLAVNGTGTSSNPPLTRYASAGASGNTSGSAWFGGGGGGATGAGVAASTSAAGAGGQGFSSSITGTAKCFAAGGGGGASNSNVGAAGACLNGASSTATAGTFNTSASSAAANSGSGGGAGGLNGSDDQPSGAGGSGAVIVSVRTAYDITFDANGGSGSIATQSINIGSSANLTSRGTSITRSNYTFSGWATTSNGSVAYADGATITPSGDATLYAVWASSLPSVNVAFDELNFDFSNVLHVVGTNGKSLNNKVLFRNVTTKGGVQVDALVTTKTLSGATIVNYESGTGAGGANSYFQVDATISSANGYAEFQFDFYQHGVSGSAGDPCKTNNTTCTGATKVKLQNVNVSAIDIDYLQWNDFTAVESYTMAANNRTKLFECVIPNSGTCASRVAPSAFPANMRFQGSADSNRTNSPQDMAIVSYAEIENFTIKFGRSASASQTNFFGVAFMALSWGADTPATVGGTTYSVTYDANTGSGNVPSGSTGAVGSNVTLPGAGSLSKSGYTFGGWMTAADGSGTTYAESTVISMPLGGLTLYAKWNAVQYMLVYKLYGGSGGPASEMRYTGATANLSSTVPTRSGNVFSRWDTKADGTGVAYAPGDSFQMPGATTTLHAIYTTATGTIAYNANNGSSAPSGSTGTSGTNVAAAAEGSMTRTNYTFSSWNTAADGTGTDYNAGANVPYPGNGLTTTLYAQWTPILYSYSYNANGGTGAPTGGSTTAGATVTIPTSTTTRTGYTFAGWTTSADGTGTVYTNGGANPSLTMPGANTVLYAKWTAITYTLAFNSNDAGAGSNPSSVTGNYGANLTAAAAPTAPTGKKFNGWNTVANGSGSTIAAQGTYQITADTTLYAQWVADTVNLFYNANGGSGAPTSTTANANQNTTLSGTAPTRIGFSFSGWTTAANGSGTVYGLSSTFPVPGSDTTLYAKWTPIGYNFIYSANGGSGSPATVAYNMGDFVVIDNTGTTVRTGYTFAGWNTLADGTGSDYVGGQSFLMSNSNMTMYAKWTSNPYTLTYNANLGAGSPTAETRNAGSSANLSSTVPTRTGYAFNGWNTAQNGSGSSYNSSASYTMPTSNSTLYAQWTANSNAVAYNSNNGSGAPSGGTFSFGASVTVSSTAPTRTGYTFLGWNTAANGSGTNYSAADTFAMPNSSVTLYAKWSILQKTVTYDANGGAGVDAAASYNYGATVTVSTAQVSRSGYSFIGWNTLADGSGTTRATNSTFTMPETDLTLYAIWSINAYTVYYNMNGGTGSVTPQPGNYGSSVIVSTTVPTRVGYTFSGWNTLAPGNGSDYTGGGTLNIPASNLTLFAKWTAIMYSVSFNANGGSGSPADVTGLTAGNNTALSVTIPIQSGYVFNGWNTAVDGSGQTYSGGQNFVVPAANTVLYAQWVANTYEIIYNANGGANAPVPANGSTNATVTLTSGSVTRSGYTHLGWSTNSGATTATYYGPSNLSFVIPAGNTILYAVWALADITLTYNINNGSGSTPSAVTDKYLETINLTPSSAFSRSGYTFTGWNTAADGSGSSYADEASFVMPNADKTLYAQWSAVYYAVEYSANGGSNAPANQFAIPGATVDVAATEPVRSGYEFNDWTEVAAGTTISPGASLTMPSSNVVLVANWVTAASVPTGGPSSSNPSPSPSLSAGSGAKKLSETVYFKGDSAVLQTAAKIKLKALAKKAVANGYALKIQVIGRVKETPDRSYDMRLSRQRANNVSNYLKSLKLKGKWVVSAAGISPENKAISRRVDIRIFW